MLVAVAPRIATKVYNYVYCVYYVVKVLEWHFTIANVFSNAYQSWLLSMLSSVTKKGLKRVS